MLDIEKRLVESKIIIADDKYISDCYILVNKEFLKSKALLNCKTQDENIMSHIPYERGEYIDLQSIGTKCELCAHGKIGIIISDTELIDYDYVKLFVNSFSYFIEFTSQEFRGGLLIKAFDENEKFVGCFASIQRRGNR